MAIGLESEPLLCAAGLAQADVQRWAALQPRLSQTRVAITAEAFDADAEATSRYLLAGEALLRQLPAKPSRSDQEQAAAEHLHAALRQVRKQFLRLHVADIYRQLTDHCSKLVRIEDLVAAAAERYPGLVPTRQQVLSERQHPQRDKDGYEIDQGVFLCQVLSHPQCGRHLVHAMLRPRPESLALRDEFERTGQIDIGQTRVERHGQVGYLLHGNPRFLNAEDDGVVPTLEIGTDLILLDPQIQVGVLRGKVVDHPKYAGRRIFNAGINLTHLYYGQIGLVDFFLVREMGYLHKMYRGLSPADYWPDEVEDTQEKPWIAAVEGFAIGGGCQQLLAMDYVLAERSSFFNLPARKEGIIPGVSNMRLWRFVGDRLARQAILFDRRFLADSPEGRLLCDEVVADGAMDAALDRTVQGLLGSGVVSAAGNRKAIRLGQESIDLFRQYLALYCREQAACHYSPQLISNLERNWNAAQRQL